MDPRKPYLWTKPDDCPDPIGKGMMTADIVAGLKRIEPRITLWEEYPSGMYWPGKKMGGSFGVKTSLWIGDPGGESVKISSITAVMVPEYTLIGEKGLTITKGWRQIFDDCIASGVVTRLQLETEFKVSLTVPGEIILCRECVKLGKRNLHNGGVLKLCRNHENIARAAAELVLWREANKPDLEEIPNEVKNVHVSVQG